MTGVQSPGSSGPPHRSSRAASSGVWTASAGAQIPEEGFSATTYGRPAATSAPSKVAFSP